MEKSGRKHFLIVTFPHFGHVIPTLELAKHISVYHDVTFVASAVIAQEIYKRELLPSTNNEPPFRIIGIEDGITLDSDSTTEKVLAEIKMMEGSPLTTLLREMPIDAEQTPIRNNSFGITKPVDMVILERFIATVLPVCVQRGVPCSLFNTSATIDKLELLDNEENAVEDDLVYLMVNRPLKQASAVLINTFHEAAVEALRDLAVHKSTADLPVFCVGPLLPEEKQEEISSDKNAVAGRKVLNWMDKQEPTSVVYISFGSLARPSAKQVQELIQALVGFGKPFVYSMQERDQQDLSESQRSSIHKQMNVEDSPYLIQSWFPQKSILRHSACGAFISHCGWNSTLEAAAAGIPVVAWPMFADQYANGQWLVDKGGAIMVPDTGLPECGGRVVPSDEILRTLEEIQDESFRSNMEKLKDRLKSATEAGGTAQQELQRFLNTGFIDKKTEAHSDATRLKRP